MALDFVQVDESDGLTGMRVALQREEHSMLLWQLPPDKFPLLARMDDYYDDVTFDKKELQGLRAELQRLSELHSEPLGRTVVSMIRLVEDSILNNFAVQAIAD